MSRVVEVKESGRTVAVPSVRQVPEWTWQCSDCGHLGLELTSEAAARKEGDGHTCEPSMLDLIPAD